MILEIIQALRKKKNICVKDKPGRQKIRFQEFGLNPVFSVNFNTHPVHVCVRRPIKSWGGTERSTKTSCPLIAYSLAEGTDYKPLPHPKLEK